MLPKEVKFQFCTTSYLLTYERLHRYDLLLADKHTIPLPLPFKKTQAVIENFALILISDNDDQGDVEGHSGEVNVNEGDERVVEENIVKERDERRREEREVEEEEREVREEEGKEGREREVEGEGEEERDEGEKEKDAWDDEEDHRLCKNESYEETSPEGDMVVILSRPMRLVIKSLQ